MPTNYLIIGDDQYFRGKEEARIRDENLSASELELNYTACGPDELETAMDSLGTMPFLAEKRVVLLREAESLTEAGAATIIAYLNSPSPTSILVLSAGAELSKAKFYKELYSLTEVITADKLKPYQIKKKINAYFKKNRTAISPKAVELLVEMKDDDTTGLKEELDKLLAFSAGERIEAEHVHRLVGRSARETVFALVDAINARKAKRVFETLNDIYEQKKRSEDIVGYLGWYLRNMQSVVLLKNKGQGEEAIRSQTRLKPWQVRKFLEQSRKYDPVKIGRWVKLLYDTDRSIKTGRKKPALAVEMLVAEYLKG